MADPKYVSLPFGFLVEWFKDTISPPLNFNITKQESTEITNNTSNVVYNTSNVLNTSNTSNVSNNYNTSNIYTGPRTFYTTNITNVTQVFKAPQILPTMPARLLPSTIAAATPTDPPNKPILSLQQSFATKKFGRLLCSPIADITEEITLIKADEYLKKYEQEVKNAAKEHEKWLNVSIFNNPNKKDNPNDVSWDKSCVLINDFNNTISLEPGLKGLTYFKQYYSSSNKSILQFSVTGIIPTKYKIKKEAIQTNDLTVQDQGIEVIGPNILNGKLGTFLLPFEMPALLLNILSDNPTVDNGELVEVPHFMALFKWFILNFDALIGEFPIKMEIEDNDPLNTGKTPVKVKIPNIAETLAELYGLSTISSQNSNIALTLLLNLIPEILGSKNVGIVNQDILKAITSYLGFKVGIRKIEYKTNFNLDNPKNWDDFISPNKDVIIQGMENLSEETIAEYMARIMYVASLQKEALLTKNKDIDKNELIKEILAKKAAQDITLDTNPTDPNLSDKDKEWLDFLLHVNKKDSSFNKKGDIDIPIKPEIDKHNKI